MHQPGENEAYGLATHDLWNKILGLVEQDLEERQCLHPILREYVAERLLDRHLAEQGRVDLLQRRHPYTREIRDLTPEDLPALIEAYRLRDEEEYHRRRTEFVREAKAQFAQFSVADLAETVSEAQR